MLVELLLDLVPLVDALVDLEQRETRAAIVAEPIPFTMRRFEPHHTSADAGDVDHLFRTRQPFADGLDELPMQDVPGVSDLRTRFIQRFDPLYRHMGGKRAIDRLPQDQKEQIGIGSRALGEQALFQFREVLGLRNERVARATEDIETSSLSDADKGAIMRGNAERLGLAE